MITTKRTTIAIALLAGIVPALLTGCSSSPGSGPDVHSPGAANDSDRWIDVARCMRAHGHDMPDDGSAKVDSSTLEGSWPIDLADCQRKAGVQVTVPTTSAADRKQALEYARCMREHGVSDYPDPSDDPGDITRYDGVHVDAFNAAGQTCDEQVYPGGAGGATAVQP